MPQNLVDAVSTGTWSEPPADSVFKLRDKLREDLVPLSPNAYSWEEYRGFTTRPSQWKTGNNAPKSWREEVEQARFLGTNTALNLNPQILIIYNPRK